MASESIKPVRKVAYSTNVYVVLWCEKDGSFCRMCVMRKMHVDSEVTSDVSLYAAKYLLCTVNAMLSLKCIITTLQYVIENDPCPWVRLRAHAALGRATMISKNPRCYIPESIAYADRGRYMALSYLIPFAFGNAKSVDRICLRTVCKYAPTILLCLKTTPIPKELFMVILNYL